MHFISLGSSIASELITMEPTKTDLGVLLRAVFNTVEGNINSVNYKHYCRETVKNEARRSHRQEATINNTRVRLDYKKGMKTYFDVCPGRVARTVNGLPICRKSSTQMPNVCMYGHVSYIPHTSLWAMY